MRPTKYRLILFASIFVLILTGYFVLRGVLASRGAVPTEFQGARSRGAVLAQDIVNTSNGINQEIAHINELERSKDYKGALARVNSIGSSSQYMRLQAIELSKELKIMAENLPVISSQEAQGEALDSISKRLDLITHLITYTDELNQLSAALTTHLKNRAAPTTDIERLVARINEEVGAINEFNSQAGQAMDRFDKIVR